MFNKLALTRVEAVTLASALLDESSLRPIGIRSADALRNAALGEQFLDDSTALYCFVSFKSLSSCFLLYSVLLFILDTRCPKPNGYDFSNSPKASTSEAV